eukprot:1618697-Pleurochrysis_carterae.AAC.4
MKDKDDTEGVLAATKSSTLDKAGALVMSSSSKARQLEGKNSMRPCLLARTCGFPDPKVTNASGLGTGDGKRWKRQGWHEGRVGRDQTFWYGHVWRTR